MRKIQLLTGGLILVTLIFTMQSCRKDSKAETAETITSAEDNSTAESEFTSLFDVSDDVSSNDARTRSGNTILPSGAVVSFQDSSFTDGDGVEYTIDFGALKPTAPKGILCLDGRYRAGVIHIKASKRYLLDSAVVEVSASDNDKFFAGNGSDMTQITGTMTLTRTGTNSIRIDVNDARAINERGTVAWQSTRTITKLMDAGPGILGDQFEVSGEASGVNRNGENFTVKIDVPLLKKVELGCARTFIKGKITITNTNSGKALSIDYDPFSNSVCDLVAKATINGKEFFFSVR